MATLHNNNDQYNKKLFTFEELMGLQPTDLVKSEVAELVLETIMTDPEYETEFGENVEVSDHLTLCLGKLAPQQLTEKDARICQELIDYLLYLRLPILPTVEVLNLLKTKTVAMFQRGIDVIDRVELFLRFNFLTAGEPIRHFMKMAIQSLRENQEIISPSVTVAQCLTDYNRTIQSSQPRSAVDRLGYINTAPILRKFSSDEQSVAIEIIELYDFLLDLIATQPSLPQAGPVVNNTGIRPRPIVTPRPVTRPITPAYSQEEIYSRYQGSEDERRQIGDRQAQIASTTGRDFSKLADQLYLMIGKPRVDELERYDVIATLRVLAETEKLDDVLREDTRFFKILHDEVVRRGDNDLATDVRVHPTSPKAIQWFLSLVFEGKLQLNENDAARFGLQLGNLLKKAGNDKYANLAYFDMTTGNFRWRK